MRITRREFCQSTATLALATALGLSALPTLSGPASSADAISEVELMAPGALPDMAMGDAKAKVTVIEYASLGCSHCATFAETTFPELKKRYIDTGKVRYILREFPLEALSATAFMMARCAGEGDSERYFTMADTLFRQQKQWYVERPLPPLFAIAKQAGFTEKTFEACRTNQKLLDGIVAVRQRAADKFKVQSTPSFFINGTPAVGALSIEDISKLIDPYLKG